MPVAAHRWYDIPDCVWELLLRTGSFWRDLLPDYWDWENTHRRFYGWCDRGVWEGLLEALITEPDFEWLMIDTSHIKVHSHTVDARAGNQAYKRGSIPRYIWPCMRMVCRSEYLLHQVRLQIARRLAS